MSNYSVTCAGVATGSTTPIIGVYSDGTVRPGVYDIVVGCDDTPADHATQFLVQRTSDDGTGGTAITPEPLDPISAAASCTSEHGTWSSGPTEVANSEMLRISVNQRATFRWVAAPGSELYGVATADNGIIVTSEVNTSSYGADVTMLFSE